MKTRLNLAYSTCPNDTFIFYGIAAGGLQLPGVRIEVELHDVETLNRMAMTARLTTTGSRRPRSLSDLMYEDSGGEAAISP